MFEKLEVGCGWTKDGCDSGGCRRGLCDHEGKAPCPLRLFELRSELRGVIGLLKIYREPKPAVLERWL